MTKTSISLFGLLAVGVLSAVAGEFTADTEKSSTRFSVTQLLVNKVGGQFSEFDCSWTYDVDRQRLTGLLGTVKVASLGTGSEKRDELIRGKDVFDVENHPEMLLRFRKYVVGAKGERIMVDATIRGITKGIEMEIKVVPGEQGRQRVSLSGTLNRFDFGLGQRYSKAFLGQDIRLVLVLEGNPK